MIGEPWAVIITGMYSVGGPSNCLYLYLSVFGKLQLAWNAFTVTTGKWGHAQLPCSAALLTLRGHSRSKYTVLNRSQSLHGYALSNSAQPLLFSML